MEPHAPSTPLISLSTAAIDTETTALDPRQARIVQIAAVRIDGGQIDWGGNWQSLVNPGEPIPAKSSAIHGIRDIDVTDAPAFGPVWHAFDRFVGQRVLIGYRTGFDISVLKRECDLSDIEWRDRHWLCVHALARLFAPAQLAVESLESLAEWLEVEIDGRHTALGDARAAAHIWVKLIPLLRQKDIRTLGEALAASGNLLNDGRQDLARQSAGIEADVSALERNRFPLRIDSYAYRRRLTDVMSTPPLYVSADMSLQEGAKLVIDKKVSSLIVSGDGRTGIVTERDLLRSLAADGADGVPVTLGSIMSYPLHTMPAETHLYRAIARMSRLGIRHLAVTGGEGSIVGVVTPRNLLRARADELIVLGDQIETATDGAGLAAARAKLSTIAKGLVADELDARSICAVMSAELCNLTRRAAEIAEARMEAVGIGPPPAAYALMVLGSGGRGESLLVPDQDNAIVYENGEPGGKEDKWFAVLGEHVADLLDEAGVPYCRGGIMAKNAEWRRSVPEWRSAIDDWVRRSRPQDLLNVDIFFDGIPVHGATGLAEEIWRYAYMRAHSSVTFQALLTELSRNWQAPLTVFGGFHADRGNRTDLKKGGLMPIFTGARVLSIRHDLPARSTADRLRALAQAGLLHGDAADAIIAAHEAILNCILLQQIEDIDSGIPPSNLVETGRLDKGRRRGLRQAIRDISILMDMVSEARL